MNDHTIHLVKESFDLVEPIAPQAADGFYELLFRLEPSLVPLFRNGPLAQGEGLMLTIAALIRRLDQPATLAPMLHRAGVCLADAGVRDEQVSAIGSAFIATVAKVTGVAFTDEVHEAWVDVYRELAASVKAAGEVAA